MELLKHNEEYDNINMNIEKYFNKIIYISLLLKTTLLFWSAHPFDFWHLLQQFNEMSFMVGIYLNIGIKGIS